VQVVDIDLLSQRNIEQILRQYCQHRLHLLQQKENLFLTDSIYFRQLNVVVVLEHCCHFMCTQQSFLVVIFADEFAGEFMVPEVQACPEVFLQLFARQVSFNLELCFSLQCF
jgi:hypothetical protein